MSFIVIKRLAPRRRRLCCVETQSGQNRTWFQQCPRTRGCWEQEVPGPGVGRAGSSQSLSEGQRAVGIPVEVGGSSSVLEQELFILSLIFCKFACWFEKQRDTRRELSFTGLLPRGNGLVRVRAGSQELRPGPPCGWQGPRLPGAGAETRSQALHCGTWGCPQPHLRGCTPAPRVTFNYWQTLQRTAG